jgi:cobalt-zinc-cadmium efflux system membrane fusion protein
LEVFKAVGSTVDAGEALAEMESAELGNAQLEYFTAQTAMEIAQQDAAREKTVHDNTQQLLALLKKNAEAAEIEETLADSAVGEHKARLLRAYAVVKLARHAWERAQKLTADKIITAAEAEKAASENESARGEFSGLREEIAYTIQQRLVQSENVLKLARTTFANAERKLRILGESPEEIAKLGSDKAAPLTHYVLRAPFAGTIVDRRIGKGERLEAGEQAFSISDLSTVWVRIDIFPKHLEAVKLGQKVLVQAQGQQTIWPGEIIWISPLVDENTRASQARVVLANPSSALRPGLFVNAGIVLGVENVAIAVPEEAVQTIHGVPVVFTTADNAETFSVQPVQLGISDGERVEIKAGLTAGQKIVKHNTFTLKAQFSKGEGGEED